jgi:hypothetical protein
LFGTERKEEDNGTNMHLINFKYANATAEIARDVFPRLTMAPSLPALIHEIT